MAEGAPPAPRREKEFTRLRDELSRQRRELPWEAVTKEYAFDAPGGSETLAELFDGRSQLVVYHFMFEPEAGTRAASTARSGPTTSTASSST